MVASRACKAAAESGQPCRAPPLLDRDFCSVHDPEYSEEMANARRLGGLRRRKERAVSEVYVIQALEDVSQVRRLWEIAVMDTLELENSIARSRTLAYLCQVALKTLEVGELEARLTALEGTVGPKKLRLG